MRGIAATLIALATLRCAGGESSKIVYPAPDIPVLDMPAGRVFSTDAPSTLAYAIEADPCTGQLVLLDFYAEQPLVLISSDGVVAGRYGARGQGPGEFDDVRSLSVAGGVATVWDYDLGRLGVLDLRRPSEVETRRLSVPEGKSRGPAARSVDDSPPIARVARLLEWPPGNLRLSHRRRSSPGRRHER